MTIDEIYDTYGTSVHTAAELAGLVADRLGLTFAEHDSYYRGIYHRSIYYRADAPPYEIEVQPARRDVSAGGSGWYQPTAGESWARIWHGGVFHGCTLLVVAVSLVECPELLVVGASLTKG